MYLNAKLSKRSKPNTVHIPQCVDIIKVFNDFLKIKCGDYMDFDR